MSAERKPLYEFEKFRCDPGEHLLFCDGKAISLAPKAFEILVVLIESNGRLLTKEDLMQKVWPDTFVEEANLTINISALRKVLGDTTGNQQFIETVPKRGYRFLAPVKVLAAAGTPSIQNTATSSAPARPTWIKRVGLSAVVLLIIGMVVVLLSTRSAKLTDKDTIVLADFANFTGDPVFDDALRQGLSSQLEQSPFLNLLSDVRIAQTMSLMAQPRDSRLTPDRARDVCQRTASTAVLNGTIAQVGKQYLLTLKAINCSTGDSLGSAQAQAGDKDHVLDALGKLASGIRGQLGESLASVQKYDAPPESVTTPSIEALKAYSLGYQAMVTKSDSVTAVPLFQQAISLDPDFAMAYARMGTCYFNLYESVKANDSTRRAYELREHLSERERLYIVSHYELVVTGNLVEARKVFELLAQTYPHEAPYTNLGIIESQLGDYDEAVAAFDKAVKIGPIPNHYANLVNGYVLVNRVNDALVTVREALAKKIDSPEIHINLYWVAFLRHDLAAMEQEAAKVLGQPGYDDQMLNLLADTAAYSGRLAKARGLMQRAVEVVNKGDQKETAALYLAETAVREALVGNASFAKQQAQAALAISNGKDVASLSAIALAIAGDSGQAKKLADELNKRFPEDTLVQLNYLPTIRAAVLLRSNDSKMAVQSLEPAAPYELGGNLLTLNFIFYPVYLRGEAYLAAKQGAAAAAEFQKILDHPGAVRSEPIGALAHLEQGRAFTLTGDKDKAKTAYQEFLTLWKDADTDVPIFKQAKDEYSHLN